MQRKCAWCGKPYGEKCPACGSSDVLPVIQIIPRNRPLWERHDAATVGRQFICLNDDCDVQSFPAGELVGQVTHGLCDECHQKNLELADGPAAQVRA